MRDAMNVDIGIPAYRRPESVCRAIESAQRQRGNVGAQRIFVVNDDPSGGLSVLAERYGVEVFENPDNLGLTANWNRVIDLARAPYLVILHDDDELLPDRIERGTALLDRTPHASMAFCAVQITDKRGAVTRDFRPFAEDRSFRGGSGALALLRHFVPVKAPGVMFRVDALRDAGGFSAACAELGDIELYLRLALRSEVVYDSRFGARCHFDAGNLTHTAMFRPRDLQLYEVVRGRIQSEVEARGLDPSVWHECLDRMAARHAVLGALYRLKVGDRDVALQCLTPVLQGQYRGAGRYRFAALLLRTMAATRRSAHAYDLLRLLQHARARLPGRRSSR